MVLILVILVYFGIIELVMFGVNLWNKFLFYVVIIGFVVVVIFIILNGVLVFVIGIGGLLVFIFIILKLILMFIVGMIIVVVILFILIWLFVKRVK